MATKTLLQITQDILSDMNGDSVNTITDTEEAEQVARIVISVFDNIVAKEKWNIHRTGITLTASGDNDFPTHMTLPSNVKELISVLYDTRKNGVNQKQYTEMKWKEPDDFLRLLNSRDSTAPSTQTVTDPSGVVMLIRNDKAPEYFTSIDDETLIFDSFDSDVDTTLQTNKTQGLAYILPTLAFSDAAIPDLPNDAMRYLIEEATSRAQYKLREFQDIKSEAESAQQRRTMSRKAWKVNKPTRYPDYGRKR